MGETCSNCGKPIGPDVYNGQCPGIVYMAPDPYAQEIHDDDTEYENCDGNRYESAQDV